MKRKVRVSHARNVLSKKNDSVFHILAHLPQSINFAENLGQREFEPIFRISDKVSGPRRANNILVVLFFVFY